MPLIKIVKSKHINAPIDKVYGIISDLGQWQVWSPWLIMDPDTEVKINDRKSYSWEGTRTGTGNMQIVDEKQNSFVAYNLIFLKPWKSKAKVRMEVTKSNGGTDVSWHMDSTLPWFMFWMKKIMETYVGMDYDRGLNLLKDYAEDGKVHSKLNFLGESQYAGCNYIYIKEKCTIDEMPISMQKNFEDLMPYAHKTEGMRPHDAICIYHKFDAVNDICEYTAGVPYDELPSDLPSHYKLGKQEATKIYTLEHVGPYTHLGNAWSTLQNMIRSKELKIVKNYHPFETYGNSPKDTHPYELISRIHFAVK